MRSSEATGLKTHFGTASSVPKYFSYQEFVDRFNDADFENLRAAVEARVKAMPPAEVNCNEFSLFVGQDILSMALIEPNRTEALKKYRERTGASLSDARRAFALAVRDYCTPAGKERLAKTCEYIAEALGH